MNLVKFAAAICVLSGSVIGLVSSLVVPGASTPVFYLVASTTNDPAANLLPLRVATATGGTSSLTGSGPIGQFYFFQGNFVLLDPTQSSTSRGNIGSVPLNSGCSPFGPLGFFGSTSDKCTAFATFGIQSNSQNSQLGAFLEFNFVGGFYACGSSQDVWYIQNPANSPPGLTCSPISLYTVPV